MKISDLLIQIIYCAWIITRRFVEGIGLTVIPERFVMESETLKGEYDRVDDHFILK
jgi:hypothetical protein